MNRIFSIFSPPHHPNYEKDVQKKFLHATQILTFILGIYFALINSGATSTVFLLLPAASLLGIYLNKAHKYYWSAALMTSISIFALYFNFYDGISLQDPGIVAIPIILIFSSFLFKRMSIFPITTVLIFGNYLIVQAERTQLISPPQLTTNNHLMILNILIIFSAGLLFGIMKNWETALERIRASEQSVKDSYLATLEGWAKALEFHDRETVGHSHRVTDLSIRFAKAIGIEDPVELEIIYRGALLHDIGKLAIPDHILLKKGELTQNERKEIQKHPNRAKELLENIPFLKPSMPIPCDHHENWDGSGYPDKLSGKNIPLHARLFSIVDNWDALTNDRPYRKAWSKNKVLSYIVDESGKKFDPSLIPVFVQMME